MSDKASKPFESLFPSGLDERGRYWVADLETLPQFVVRDLRNGMLESLSRYLAECGGTVDATIIVQIIGMIRCDSSEHDYCLKAVRNPKVPSAKKTRSQRLAIDKLCMDMAEDLYGNMGANENAKSRVTKVRGKLTHSAASQKALRGKKLLADPLMRARKVLQDRYGLDAEAADIALEAAMRKLGAKPAR